MRNVFIQIITSTWKEFLLLFRDRAGLLVLFLMPSALVIIVTLVQENVMELTGEKNSEILFLDQDHGIVAAKLRKALLDSGRIDVVNLDDAIGAEENAISRVADGEYQVCVIIPPGISDSLTENIADLFADSDEGSDIREPASNPLDSIPVYFDPGVMPGFRSGILAVLRMAILSVEMDLKISAFDSRLANFMERFRPYLGTESEQPDMQLDTLRKDFLTIDEETAGNVRSAEIHSAVQYNIPAWSLFALFFISISLAASLLLERNSGIWQRIMAMPVYRVTILMGKIVSCVAVCFCQIVLIYGIGRYLFPYLGLPAFSIGGSQLSLLILISLCCSLAACGYGIFLGSFCSTLEQASMFGSISIVIAAALGGTMVPVYAMPRIMQKISEVSPLNWGLEAFLDVLMRDASLVEVGGNLAKLLVFFMTALAISWKVTREVK